MNVHEFDIALVRNGRNLVVVVVVAGKKNAM
jgi:hypothetical protein